jgi:hypothetical protein
MIQHKEEREIKYKMSSKKHYSDRERCHQDILDNLFRFKDINYPDKLIENNGYIIK